MIKGLNNQVDTKEQAIKILEKKLKDAENQQQLKDIDWAKAKSQLDKKLKDKEEENQWSN